MSKKASPAAIGGFVIGAMVLLIIGVMLFSSGQFFARTYKIMAVFPGNVQGLNIGAAVVLRGVRIGSVTNIDVVLDNQTKAITVPVYMEIERGTVKNSDFKDLAKSETEKEWKQEAEALIQGGLRAQLKLQSLVTGQMIIDLDFYPDTPIQLSHIDDHIVEVPTVETITDKLVNQFEQLPLQAIADKFLDTLSAINTLIRSEELKETIHNTNLTLIQLQQTLNSVDTALYTTLKDISKLTRHVDNQVDPLTNSAITALNEANSALTSLDNMVGKDSATRTELDNALNELAKSARSFRILANYLERHPESLLKGKDY